MDEGPKINFDPSFLGTIVKFRSLNLQNNSKPQDSG